MHQSKVEICCCSIFLCRKFLLRPAPSIWYISLLVGSLTHDDGSPLFQWLKTQPPTRFFWPNTEEDCKTHFQLQVHQVSQLRPVPCACCSLHLRSIRTAAADWTSKYFPPHKEKEHETWHEPTQQSEEERFATNSFSPANLNWMSVINLFNCRPCTSEVI